MSHTLRFNALPVPVQEQLLRIARTAAGMSADEKAGARVVLGSFGLHAAQSIADEGVPSVELVMACAQVVRLLDEASGDEASGLVVR